MHRLTATLSRDAGDDPPASVADIARDYWTSDQLAAGLNVSLRTLQQWHRLRKGPPRIVLGNLRLYRKTSVSAWLAARETGEPRCRRA